MIAKLPEKPIGSHAPPAKLTARHAQKPFRAVLLERAKVALEVPKPAMPRRTEPSGAKSVEPDTNESAAPMTLEEKHDEADRQDFGEPKGAPIEPLDPFDRMFVPPLGTHPLHAPTTTQSVAAQTTHALAPELLDQAAFFGDGTRGIARLRFGARARGGLSGATVTIEHDGDALSLRVDGDSELEEKLRARLTERGLKVVD